MMTATQGSGRGSDGAETTEPSVGELSFSSAGAELDAIIEEFETGVIDVDRLVDQLERATDIVDELDRRLRRTRMRVEELVPRLEAIGRDGGSGEAPTEEEYSADADGDADGPAHGDGEEPPPGLF